MPFIDTLTINEEHKSEGEILEIIWKALEYFPKGLWDGVNYLGNINMMHDVKIRVESKKTVHGAFVFNRLVNKIKRVRELLQIKELLLAVTCDPIIALYHTFNFEKLSRTATLVHDYFSKDIGIVSFFRVKEEENATKVVAHGLGHSLGLRHHVKPIDLMYEGLLECDNLINDGFCSECLKRMRQD